MIDYTAESDRRYRIFVMLNRSDRPTHYKFYCPRCKREVCELMNSKIESLSDIVDMEENGIPMNGVRCDGKIEERNEPCRTWYYFSLNKVGK